MIFPKDEPDSMFMCVNRVPYKDFDRDAFLDAIGITPFSITYDLEQQKCILCIGSNNAESIFKAIQSSIPGTEFSQATNPFTHLSKFTVLSGYRLPETIEPTFLSNIFDRKHGSASIIINPVLATGIEKEKRRIEAALSNRKAGETLSLPSGTFGRRLQTSYHTENFDGSSDMLMLKSMLESINGSVARNGICYKIVFAVEGPSMKELVDYISSNIAVISTESRRFSNFPIHAAKEANAFPIGRDFIGKLINLHGAAGLSYSMKTHTPIYNTGIEIGTYMKDGVSMTDRKLSIDPSTFNLGFIISGLPGSGKTKECMAITAGLIKGKPMLAILSPTNEWADFAKAQGLHLVRLCDSETPINFFKCPKNSQPTKFYEDLSMLIASASGAGPYRGPIEKCILNAFKRLYAAGTAPNPIDAYDAIEDSIIEFHAKRSAGGIKYTKHGENIRSSLENLREIIARPEYSLDDGIDIEAALRQGVVFDMSLVSNSSKPYMSALILNQLYSIANSFPMDSDNKLAMLMCIEEAQTFFRERDSAAVQDLRLRIQDFRKQGIGLILMAHNANDIDQGIRRLCQSKLYLKQAPDVAETAANDLLFTYAEEGEIPQKLKHLDSRIGAFSSVMKNGNEKLSEDTIFIRTMDYMDESTSPNSVIEIKRPRVPKMITAELTLEVKGSLLGVSGPKRLTWIRICCLAEKIYELPVLSDSCKYELQLVDGRRYHAKALDTLGRAVSEKKFTCSKSINLEIGSIEGRPSIVIQT